ncbi:hypothetical protein BPAE_0045g00250 [Botrytis paeoniae]|uniref:Uncharacterized protein n=1 Tax=Botrytis paeoniae TaxID=278948 RepID=A0A4Z1FU59_9HELO|nr:hypothetical protein BPAE_0045g00250 [Botrytis paeoniae]
MGLLNFFFGKIKDSRHEHHNGHTKKSSKSNKPDTAYRSDVTQDSQHAKRAQVPHRSENRNENSSQTNHVYKTSYSVKERIKYIGDYIDDWNNKNPPHDHIKIDIIILKGLLDINQNLTEPRSGSQVRFISNPEELWDKLSSEKLQRACKKLEWHTHDRWHPYTLDSGVRKRMFEVADNDRPVYRSKMKGLMIRGPPLDYRICQRIDRLGGRESNPQLYDTKLSEIVEDIESYINNNKQQLDGIRSKSKRGVVTPRDLIKIWQKEYHFQFSNVLLSLKKSGVERSKSRENSGTGSHESHRVHGPHDSAVFLPNTGRRAPSKSRAHKSSNYGSDSDTSTSTSTRPRRVNKQHDSAISLSDAGERAPSKSRAHTPSDHVSDSETPTTRSRRRTQTTSRPPAQRQLQTQSNHNTLENPASHTERPLITINSSSGYKRGRSPGESSHRKSPGRSPHTPRTPVNKNRIYQNSAKPPLPPSLHSLDHGRQKSPARPGGRGTMTQERSHQELLHPSTSQSQSYSYPHVNSNDNSESRPEMRPRKSHRDLFNDNLRSRPQQQFNSNHYSLTNSNRINGYPGPSHQDSYAVSPVEDLGDMSLKGLTPEQKEEIHRKAMEEYKMEGGNG